MPVRMSCPRCNGPCLVADQHLGATVQCSHCRQPFVARPAPAEAPPRPPRLEVGSATSVGRVRSRNEDSFLVQHVAWSNVDGFQEVVLLALADGMGGYEAGHQASRLVIETVGGDAGPVAGRRWTGQLKTASPTVLAENIDYALLEANRAVLRKGQSRPGLQGDGGDGRGRVDLGGPGADRPRRRLPGLPPARRPCDAADEGPNAGGADG